MTWQVPLGVVFVLATSFAHAGGMSIEEGRKLWSLIPPKAMQDDLDSLVSVKLAEQKLTPNGAADPRSLVRRLYFDLTGLPPSPEEAAAFEMKNIERVVDQLLASKHFGERWGRHWLDAARYADSNGRDRNVIFYHAWRYRDYVIDSFNADKPYDQFIREQIAGDLMASKHQAQRDEMLTATGFLALGAKSYEESKPEIFRMDVIDEQIETISRSVLGLSVACARCHDHKFDPIPTADYYALAGILRSTQPLYGYGTRGIKATAFHHTEWHALGDEAKKLAPAALEYFHKLDAETLAMHEARSARYGVSKRIPEMKRRLGEVSGAEKDKLAAEIAEMEAKVADWNVKVDVLEKSVEAMKDAAPPQPAWAMGAREREKIENSRIHIRGEITNLGDAVPRGFLQVIAIKAVSAPAPKQSGRLELAQWLTHRDNPLTARVMVNRVWQKLFGRALVTTVDDFGVSGAKPSHPELLDHLAVRFMDGGWSVKRLIKEIVLSKTYRRSSDASDQSDKSDPDNIYLWRMTPRMIEAEVLRDSMLALSGQLDPYPPQRQFLDQFNPQREAELHTFKPFLTASAIVSTHRSVYLPVIRGTLPEIFTLFNFAAPERPVAQRDESILPAQSLYLMNNPWVIEQARHTAKRLLSGSSDDRERIQRLYALAFARAPTSEEMQRALRFVSNGQETAWATLCQTVMASAEFRILP
ncbi:DUF1553 domain-containing protein [Prosthecobacter sp.]|uniref:DUF1549 and DUF1553 domain-containing protein n=1 Tax=Prosthecobacter sp. TaxID=1965333 RepID=UPI002ABB44DA|nr:DUF1553 domain-containing protein [Prosthecobacter sp.]MDZ4406057.1 DUF1553 domain-containing protein [Prosthecobacter sp.]